MRRAIGQAIREARERAGKTQDEVAEEANISSRELRRIEGGKGGMQLDRLWPIARAVGCRPTELVEKAEDIERA